MDYTEYKSLTFERTHAGILEIVTGAIATITGGADTNGAGMKGASTNGVSTASRGGTANITATSRAGSVTMSPRPTGGTGPAIHTATTATGYRSSYVAASIDRNPIDRSA
jgi:hypothetical protein